MMQNILKHNNNTCACFQILNSVSIIGTSIKLSTLTYRARSLTENCRSMSGTQLMKYGERQRTLRRGSLATPEEFVKVFGGSRLINKVKQ